MIKEIAKTKFRQLSAGWCSVYTIANIFNNKNALDFLSEERFKGSTDKEEVEVLNHIGQNLMISNIFFSTPLVQSPPTYYVWNAIRKIVELDKEHVEKLPENLLPFTAYLLCVRLTKTTSLWHRVCIISYKERFFYLDPLREYILEINDDLDLTQLFEECAGIDRLSAMDGDLERYQIMFGEKLGHEWMKELI